MQDITAVIKIIEKLQNIEQDIFNELFNSDDIHMLKNILSLNDEYSDIELKNKILDILTENISKIENLNKSTLSDESIALFDELRTQLILKHIFIMKHK